MRFLRGFLYFWYDFIVGDAWEVAGAVLAALVIAWVVVRGRPELGAAVGPALAVALMAAMSASLWWERRGRRWR